jgi:hypothetical protein
MKQLKGLILISCLSFVINCKTTPPLQFQENGQKQVFLVVTGSNSSSINSDKAEINEEDTDYNNRDEMTFMNVPKADLDKLSLIEGIWSDDRNTYKIEIQKTEDKGKYVAFILNSRESLMKKGGIIGEFFKTLNEHIYFTKYYLDDKTKIVTKTYIDDHGMLIILLEKWGEKDVTFFRDLPVKETTEAEKVSELKQSLVKGDETGSDEYYVQVVAFKNHDDAQKLLVKLKKYYPEAYIVMHDSFNKIRIPSVSTKKQGAIVSKDLEKKFNLKPIVVLKKQ